MLESFPIEKFTSRSEYIFKNIPSEIRQRLEDQMVDRTYRKSQNIFLEGLYPSGIFYLKEGLVKKYKTDHTGKEHILYLCAPGELLGYPALLCHEPYPDSAAAIEDSKLGFISRDQFLRVLNESSELMLSVLTSLSHEFGVMVNSVTVFAGMSVRERLALNLLLLAEKFKKISPSNPPAILLSREDLANMVGTATESVVRMLQEFKKCGVIELDGKKILIVKPKELIEISKFY